MDFIIQLYASNFHDPLATIEPAGFHRRSTLYASCSKFLVVLSDTKEGLDIICQHPVYILWPKQAQLPFAGSPQKREVRRIDMWFLSTKETVFWRIRSTFDMMLDWTRDFDDPFLLDLAVDLLELSG